VGPLTAKEEKGKKASVAFRRSLQTAVCKARGSTFLWSVFLI